jgi:hypothetical protein
VELIIAMRKTVISSERCSHGDKRYLLKGARKMDIKHNKWIVKFVIGAAIAALSGTSYARDPGINQPGVVGGTAGVGAPGAGGWDPGLNQPGAMGNVAVGGAPGAGRRDPGINQPGAVGNVGGGAPGVGVRDPGINQPGAIGNTGPARRSVR